MIPAPQLVLVPLEDVRPSPVNVRRFIDTEELETLVQVYRDVEAGVTGAVLPDAPIVRPTVEGYEILAGERRVTAALMAGWLTLPCRVEYLTDEQAYLFQLQHNEQAGLTTAEIAVRVYEMVQLGYTHKEISRAIGGGNVPRYALVGSLIDPDWFNDEKKLCDPSITEWTDAANFGKHHFRQCFANWVNGVWDAPQCSKMFRRRGEVLPLDTTERGFRLTRVNNRLTLRGTLDLDLIELYTAQQMLVTLGQSLDAARIAMLENGQFGPRFTELINPITVGDFADGDS